MGHRPPDRSAATKIYGTVRWRRPSRLGNFAIENRRTVRWHRERVAAGFGPRLAKFIVKWTHSAQNLVQPFLSPVTFGEVLAGLKISCGRGFWPSLSKVYCEMGSAQGSVHVAPVTKAAENASLVPRRLSN